jgi:Domain of unknown function (DUF5615)
VHDSPARQAHQQEPPAVLVPTRWGRRSTEEASRCVRQGESWAGHEVRSVDEERELDGWDDEALLALATAEKRVLITFDVKDFPGAPVP